MQAEICPIFSDSHVSAAPESVDRIDAKWTKSSLTMPVFIGIRKEVGEWLSHMG